jgi:Fe2+ or Zn2+ uptake regulation protein
MNFEDAENSYRSYLTKSKMFYTKERAIILSAVLDRKDHFSVDDLLFLMKSEDLKVSRATLYRSVSQMVEAGILVEADFGHGHIHYEMSDANKNHEHLVCKNCDQVIEVDSKQVQEAIDHIAKNHGFKVITIKTQILGLCKKCQLAG